MSNKLAPTLDPLDKIIFQAEAIRDFLYGSDSGVSVHRVRYQLRAGLIPGFRIGRYFATTPRLLQGMGKPVGEEAA